MKFEYFIRYIFFYLIIASFFFHTQSFAQNFLNLHNARSDFVYYDADGDIHANIKTGDIELNQNASILLGNLYINASRIVILNDIGLITAEGDVHFILDKEKAIASKIVVDLHTKQIRMDDALIFSDPNSSDDTLQNDALGITKAELAFEHDKVLRTTEISTELKKVRDRYVNLKNLLQFHKEDAELKNKVDAETKHYSQLLARYTRTEFQPNAYFAALPEETKKKLLRRREAVKKFNEDNPQIASQIGNFNSIHGYIRVSASEILQKDDHTFLLNSSIITPCHCSSLGEPPLYGFSSKNAELDIGNYLTLQGATFDIFSLPVLYIPWFKFSIKRERESGFLYPSIYISNNSGSAVSIPFYLTLGKHADSTITYRNFTTRGNQVEAELRAQVDQSTVSDSQRTQYYSLFNYMKDRKYHDEYEKNLSKIDAAKNSGFIPGSTDPLPDNIDDYRGYSKSDRWYSQTSLVVPFENNIAFKANGQFVSDNTYLSDTSMAAVDPTSAVFGDTSPASKRFLNQELNAEYYGDNNILSIRVQGQQDLFSQTKSNTPMRLPRVEYTLLPSHYFHLPFVLSNQTSWEYITRPGVSNYLTQSMPTSFYSPLDGQRIYSSSVISYPFPVNDYVNASASASIIGSQYLFNKRDNDLKKDPYQYYLKYQIDVDSPIYARHDFENKDSKTFGSITETVDPFINITYLPKVFRSADFPFTYDLWYSQDSSTNLAMNPIGGSLPILPLGQLSYLTFGATTSWRVQKKHYETNQKYLDRFLRKSTPEPIHLNYLNDSLVENKIAAGEDSKNIFEMSSSSVASNVFDTWAKKELNSYSNEVANEEQNENYYWPGNNYYSEVTDLDFVPLSISIMTNYNLWANKTAEDQNAYAGPDFNTTSYFPAQKMGDIITFIDVNLNPLIPLHTNSTLTYSPFYSRLQSLAYLLQITLPYHIDLNYQYAFQYVLPGLNLDFVKKTQNSATVIYKPIDLISIGSQISYNVDPAASDVDTGGGRAYGTSFYVKFNHIQDCLDLIIVRNKPAGSAENQATYQLGLSMNIFGASTGYYYMGSNES